MASHVAASPVATTTAVDRTQALTLLLSAWALPNAVLVALINVALPEIQREFAVSAGTLTWAASGYIVAGAIGAVIYGRLSDVIGLRRIGVICLVAFGLISVGVAAAPSFGVLVGLRVPQGLFGMALPSLAMGGIILILPPGLRAKAVGVMMAMFGLGLVIGSIGGGVLIELTNWRVPFVVVGVLAIALIPPSLALIPPIAGADDAPRFDKVGGALVTIAVGATLLAANQLPRLGRLGIGLTAAAVAVVFWIAFLRQIRHARHPFVDPVVLRSRPFLRSCSIAGLSQAMFVSTSFVFPLALQNVFGYSVQDVGFVMSVGYITVLILGLSGSKIIATLGPYRTLMLAAGLSVIGAVGCSLFGVQWLLPIPIMFAVLGGAYTLAQPVLMNAAGRMLPVGHSGAGMGFYNFTYFAAGAFAVALAGGIIERTSTNAESWTGLHTSPGVGYVDAFVPLLVFAVLFIVVLVRLLPDLRKAATVV